MSIENVVDMAKKGGRVTDQQSRVIRKEEVEYFNWLSSFLWFLTTYIIFETSGINIAFNEAIENIYDV